MNKQLTESYNFLKNFMPKGEHQVVFDNARRSEEKDFFIDKIAEMIEKIRGVPKLYAQDGKGDAAIVHLHYFGRGDWYITELDLLTGEAFGYCDLGMGHPELGYVPINELIRVGNELDLYFTPRTLGEIKAKKR